MLRTVYHRMGIRVMVYLLTRTRFVWGVRFASIGSLLVLALYVGYNSMPTVITEMEITELGSHDTMTPEERGAMVKHYCETTAGVPSQPGIDNRKRMLIYEPLNVTLCYAPKAGCTFWKRVFISLQTSSGGKTENAFALGKNSAHNSKIGNLANFDSVDKSNKYLFESKRFLFVREPYSRLFSAYIDKFYLGDFWVHGPKIIKYLRKNIKNPRCGHDVSFTEYLRMVINEKISASIGGGDEHWLPISLMCKACEYNYQYIGKVETFDNDRSFIMRKLGIDSYVKSTISRDETVRDAIVQAVQTYWNKGVEPCMSKKAFITRLYESFKIQGYVPMNSSVAVSKNTTQNEYINAVLNNYRKNRPTLTQWDKQRRKAIVQAYSDIPFSLKLAIANTFEWDFRLFGYNPKPIDIFYKRGSINK